MSNAADIKTTGRDIFFSTAGRSINDGLTQQTPVDSVVRAVEIAMALVPPPAIATPASINAYISGTYSDGIVVPAGVGVNCNFASIVTFDPIAFTGGSNQEAQWGNLLQLAPAGVCYKVDGLSRHAADVNSIVPNSANSTGFVVTGNCSDVFFKFPQGVLGGDGATLIKHDATGDQPIPYEFSIVGLNSTNQTFIDFDPGVGSAEVFINGSSIEIDPMGTTTGSTIFIARGGDLIVDVEVLVAEVIGLVKPNARLTIDSTAFFGDLIVEELGGCILKSTGLLFGDAQIDGSMVADINAWLGVVTIGATGSTTFNPREFNGQIVNDGVMDCIIQKYNGAAIVNNGIMNCLIQDYNGPPVVNTGTINGIINGVRYGNWVVAVEALITPELDIQKELRPDGLGGVQWLTRFKDYHQLESLGASSTNIDYDVAPSVKLDEDVTLEAGDYEITTSFTPSVSATNRSAVVALLVDGVLAYPEYGKEAKDPSDTPWPSKTYKRSFTAGLHNFVIQFGRRGGGGASLVTLQDVRINIKRVG